MEPNSPILLALGLFTSLSVLAAVVWGRLRRIVVPRAGKWGSDPITIWEPVEFTNDDKVNLVTAIAVWVELGHRLTIGNVGTQFIGIVVDKGLDTRDSVEDETVTFGRTRVTQERGQIVSATVRVLPEPSALTLAHELGHALGFLHPAGVPTGHLLHPTNPGWDTRGLEGP